MATSSKFKWGVETWVAFFDAYHYTGEIQSIASVYPERRTLEVQYEDLWEFNMEFEEYIEFEPDDALRLGVAAMKECMASLLDEVKDMRLYISVKGFPKSSRVPIRNLREANLNHVVVVEGIAKRVTEVRPKVSIAGFECLRCRHVTRIPQNTPNLDLPLECPKDEGGCGRTAGSTKFEFRMDSSVMINTQKIEVQESPELLRGGSQPQTMVCHSFDDLCGLITPGGKVVVAGILRAHPRDMKHTTFDVYMDVNFIEQLDADADVMEISPEEDAEILRISELPDVQDVLTSSIAPSIFGYEIIKKAILLQLFGGISKVTPDGTRLRGDPHILLIGDPGTAKSQMLRYVAQLVPRGTYASGKSTSAAGLTACAVKDEFGEGKWTLEAGAMVLADGGMCCVDELDKMSKEDRSSMHEAMEQQSISLNKASIHATLPTRCSVLAAANPKLGRFSSDQPTIEQIDLPPTLFSRFDLIFPMTDVPDQDRDSDIAEHILNSHFAGQAQRRHDASLAVSDSARIGVALKSIKPIIKPDLLRKYVFRAKKLVPMMTEEAFLYVKKFYLQVRSNGYGPSSPVPITARQLEGLVRLSEASARSRMSDTIEERDAKVACDIVNEFLIRIVARGTGGRMDIDSVIGTPKSQRDLMMIMNQVADSLTREYDGGWTYFQFEEDCITSGVPQAKVSHYFEALKQREIYQCGTREGMKVYKKA